MPIVAARPASVWIAQTLSPRRPPEWWAEHLDSSIIWDEIRSHSDIQNVGQRLFVGSASEKRTKWRSLNNFARQAKAYYDALEVTRGTARGLLGYYSALNLAKAELLHSQPSAVIDKRIGHGLTFSFSPKTINGDFVTVGKGVFPMLYEARTGRTLPIGTKLRIRKLLARIPEIGREYSMAFEERSSIDIGWFRVMGANEQYWPVVMLSKTVDDLNGSREWARLTRRFNLVQRHQNWRQYFPDIGQRDLPPVFLEGAVTHPAPQPGKVPIGKCVDDLMYGLEGAIEAPLDGRGDFQVSPSMIKTKEFPMPTFLARYAVMFYLSNLVRYRPSRLNPQTEQLNAWLLEAYARQAPERLLANGLEGVLQKNVIFNA